MGYDVSREPIQTSKFPHLLVVVLLWLALALLFVWSMYW
jgi:hypothetical protein